MTTKHFMSARDFEAALAVFKERGVNAGELCKLLGCGNNQVWRWRTTGGAPRYVALAITALLEDLPPWKPPRTRRK